MKTDPIKVKIKPSGLENELRKINQDDKIFLRITFSLDNPDKLATDNIPFYADWLEQRCIYLQNTIYKKNREIMELIKSKE
jgi:hypothetical protein